MKAKQEEQIAAVESYKKKNTEHNNRIQAMTQEKAALHNEIAERNHTISDKVMSLIHSEFVAMEKIDLA